MTSTITDRLNGVATSVAVKVPCRAATTGPITLFGLQTVDGIALAARDRVLVKDQASAADNGIYLALSGDWLRATDFDGTFDAVGGTQIFVHSGTVNSNSYWRVDGDDPVSVGSDEIEFSSAYIDDSATAAFIQSGTGASATTVQGELRGAVKTSQFATFANAAAQAIAADLPLLVDADRSLVANYSGAVTLQAGGGIITTGAFNLTVAAIDGLEIPLFDKAGTGVITLSTGVALLGWFSPTADGVAVDTNAVYRWVNSSLLRETRLSATILTGTTTIPNDNILRSTLIGAGRNRTYFKSLTGADIFLLPGVEVGGLDYVNNLHAGGYSAIGQGRTTGSGYLMHVPTTVSTGRGCYFFDMDCDSIGGGTFRDMCSIGLFSTTWEDLAGGNCGSHVFEMMGGGPASVMINCYPRNAKKEKAGFRVYQQNLELYNCNGLDVDTEAGSFWGIFGASTSNVAISATTVGALTIPLYSTNYAANPLLRHCNVEHILDVGLLAINGTVRMDDSCIFQTAVGRSNCIALYCTDDVGSGTQGSLTPVGNFVLSSGSSWAQSCPVWVKNATAIFAPPRTFGGAAHLPVWNYTDSSAFRLAAAGTLYVGGSVNGLEFAARFGALSAGVFGITPQTPASATATGFTGQVAVDANYIYVCTASNTWKRVAVATW